MSEFKVGQKVKAVDVQHREDALTHGQVYVISEVQHPSHVQVEGVPEWFFARRFEAVSASCFVVGDRVRITGDSNANGLGIGSIGTVVRKHETSFSGRRAYLVTKDPTVTTWEYGVCTNVWADEMELAAPETNTLDIKTGDRIRTTKTFESGKQITELVVGDVTVSHKGKAYTNTDPSGVLGKVVYLDPSEGYDVEVIERYVAPEPSLPVGTVAKTKDKNTKVKISEERFLDVATGCDWATSSFRTFDQQVRDGVLTVVFTPNESKEVSA